MSAADAFIHRRDRDVWCVLIINTVDKAEGRFLVRGYLADGLLSALSAPA